MLQHPDKYLYIPMSTPGGLDSLIYDLELTINTALSMKRIPIIQKFETSRKHRLDNIKKNSVVDWNRCINLSETKILAVTPDRAIKEISDTLQYVYKRDFNFDLYLKNQIRFIDKTQIYDEANNQYPVICLMPSRHLSEQNKLLVLFNELHLKSRVDTYYNPSFFIDFLPSRKVNDLTDIVLNHLGTTRASIKTLSNILYEIPEVRYTDKKIHHEDLNYYACMHVRYEADNQKALELLKKSSALRRAIKKVLNVVYTRNHKSLPLYIMSNITSGDYFDFLKSKYNVYRYTDSKEFREQLSQNQETAHILLFMVEKNIMKHAIVKILSFQRNQFIHEYPWQQMRRIF